MPVSQQKNVTKTLFSIIILIIFNIIEVNLNYSVLSHMSSGRTIEKRRNKMKKLKKKAKKPESIVVVRSSEANNQVGQQHQEPDPDPDPI